MNRGEVIRQAFETITWQDWSEYPLEPGAGDLDRLTRAASSQTELIALHSLLRIHAWIWPLVKDERRGDVLALGDIAVETLRDDGDVRFVSITSGDKRWVVAWGGMAGDEPTIRLGVPDTMLDSGQRKLAYCRLPMGNDTLRGRLLAEGRDIGLMFDLFSELKRIIPPDCLNVLDGSRRDDQLCDACVDGILAIDGGLGGSAAAELHANAEQHAAKVVFDWAAPQLADISRFMIDQGCMHGRAVRFNDGERIACGVETELPGVHGFYCSTFPHARDGDRYLTLLMGDETIGGTSIGSYLLAQDVTVGQAMELIRDGQMEPTVLHDYATGVTVFHEGSMSDVCRIARSVEQTHLMTACFNHENDGSYHEILSDLGEADLHFGSVRR